MVTDTGVSDTDDITALVSVTFFVPAGTLVADDDITLFADGLEIGTASVAIDGSFSAAANLPGDGEHAITYTTTDPAGNSSAASPALTVTLDTTIAAPTLTTPVEFDDRVNAAEQPDVLVEGTAESNSTLTVTFDDASNPVITSIVTADALGAWTLLGSEADLSPFDDGEITVTINADDAAGNTSAAISYELLLDSDVPTQPVVTSLVSNTSVPQISGTVVTGLEKP